MISRVCVIPRKTVLIKQDLKLLFSSTTFNIKIFDPSGFYVGIRKEQWIQFLFF